MKKATALTLAGLMAISSAASASMSRWAGFGVSQLFIADVQDIWTLPGVVASNADATYFEFGTTTQAANAGTAGYSARPVATWGGAHMTLGPGVLAIWGNRPYTENSNINTAGITIPNSGASSGALLIPSQQIDLIYAFNVSETLGLGIGINRGVSSTATETAPSGGTTSKREDTASDFGISLGAEIKEVGPIALLEVGLQYNMASATSSQTVVAGTDKVTAAGTDLDLRIGGDIKGDKGGFQRVEIGVNTDAINIKDEPATAPVAPAFVESKNSAMAWNLGWAKGMSNDKGMGLGGFILSGLGQSRNEENNGTAVNKADTSGMTLAFVAAGEGKIKEWLTARAGLSSNLFQSNSTVTETGASGSTTKVTTTNSGTAATALTTGLSLNFGDITIDGLLNQDVLYTGGFLFSGVPAALFSQVSATWAWGGSKE